MGQLHQILAVEDGKMTTFKKVVEEGISTFSSKPELFKGLTTEQVSEFQSDNPKYKEYPDSTEAVPVSETVLGKLRYVFDAAIEYFDLVAQKDKTNQTASADLMVDGVVILSNVPAVTLLFIENKMKSVRGLIEAVKTLDPAKIWSPKPGQDNVFQAVPVSKPVKEPEEKWQIVAPATDKHPAQVQKIISHELRATKSSTELSGLI